MSAAGKSFYVTGGTLRHDAPSYVERRADQELFEGLANGEFCYVLTSRQMGKSSLMVRTANRLRSEGMHVIVLDLTAMGQNLTPEQWYDGLLGRMGHQLKMEDELEAFWQANHRLGPLQRLMAGLEKIVLPSLDRPDSRLVIFVDELDTVRSLPFSTDEFFAAIRECYNRRTAEPEFGRLTFCLLGVATPSDLIQDTRTTPFNIGRRIELNDFTPEEASPLIDGLHARDRATAQGVPAGSGGGLAMADPTGRERRQLESVLERILAWTGGHPYLTQRLCRTIAENVPSQGTTSGGCPSEEGVDRTCRALFLSSRAKERDDNLLFVREWLLRNEIDLAGLLSLYEKVHRGGHVPDDERNPFVSVLRLSGIVRAENGRLTVRNRIYREAFDREWVKTNMPDAEVRRQREAFRRGLKRGALAGAAGLVSLVLLGFGFREARQAATASRAVSTLAAAYEGIDSYRDTMEMRMDMDLEGLSVVSEGLCEVAFQKPNKLKLVSRVNMGFTTVEKEIVCDGKTLWVGFPQLDQYLRGTAPATLPEVLQRATEMSGGDMDTFLYSIAGSASAKTAMRMRTENTKFEREIEYGDQRANQLVWEELDEASLPRSSDGPETVVIPVKAVVRPRDGAILQMEKNLTGIATSANFPRPGGASAGPMSIGRFILTLVYTNIEINPVLPAETFVFTPERSAMEVPGIDFGVLFSVGRSADVEPKFSPAELADLIPLRDPDAGPELIDLSGKYNAPLNRPWHSERSGNDLSNLPRGIQEFAGVRFEVRGVIQLAGRAEPYLVRIYPDRVRDIAVHRQCSKLHFLQATGWKAVPGRQVGYYLVNYQGGEQRVIPILYGFDVRDWWEQSVEELNSRTGLEAAWCGKAGQGPNVPEIRLYKQTWDNPLPNRQIETIDFISAMIEPAPFLIAITSGP